MADRRIKDHPILEIPRAKKVGFSFNGRALEGLAGEPITSALIAAGEEVFGHHPKDGSPQGMFCANGQCSQCLVMADGRPVKGCMTPLTEGLALESAEGLPRLPENGAPPVMKSPPVVEVEVLIIGGGPAGLAAAIELGRQGVDTLLVDDKDRLGGKLLLQTHKFFGSVADSRAGTRGFEIARLLAREAAGSASVRVWLNSPVVGVFSDGLVGLVKGNMYRLIKPQRLLVTTGARERMLSFPGNTLPGVYGAGAFQTLVNRDLVKCSDRVLVVGGGNVGLITAYHGLQAGIDIVALVEALPKCGGYKVHEDKLKRLGVPVLTGHTVVAVEGNGRVERVTIGALDKDWQVVPGSEQTFEVDTVLIAVGLTPVDEFFLKAQKWGLEVFSAGDAKEIAEASSAMFSGKVAGLEVARSLGIYRGEIPRDWEAKAEILKSHPGEPVERPEPQAEAGVLPVFHCFQEIPCNPCTSVCPQKAISTEGDRITGLPAFDEAIQCKGCLACVAICPGLAISLVDYRQDAERPTVTLPFEVGRGRVEQGQKLALTDSDGAVLGRWEVSRVIENAKKFPGTLLVQFQVDRAAAKKVIGIVVQEKQIDPLETYHHQALPDEAIVCRCERVTAGEIRTAIRAGMRDMNHLKAVLRVGMGACGSKTCRPMVYRLFAEEGVDLKQVTDRTDRPVFVEVPMGVLAGARGGEAPETEGGDR